jgi:subtilase family serine protease
MPVSPQGGPGSQQVAAQAAMQQAGGVVQVAPNLLQTAPQGVRTYIHLPLRNSDQLDNLIREQSTQGSPLYHHWLTPAQFRASYGPTAQSLDSVATYLSGQGFKTTITSQGVVADAPEATVERAFSIHLANRLSPLATRGIAPPLAADRAPTLPAQLAALGAHVAAFAPLPPAQSQLMVLNKQGSTTPFNRYGQYGPYWFDDLKQAYRYPSYTVATGTGHTIAILAVSNYLQSDMSAYFGNELLPVPNILVRSVDGGPPAFNPNSGDSFEVSLDIQQAGGSAPGANIIVYGAPDASITPSFLDMYTAVVEDDLADVVTSSFGLCELYFTAAYNGGTDYTYLFQDFHDIFRQGNAEGMTFVNASGDGGAKNCLDPTGSFAVYGILWPANDPDVTAVGGTNIQTSYKPGTLDSAYISENADDDKWAPGNAAPGSGWGSGGGKGIYWKRPVYQNLVDTDSAYRTNPDLAMHMGGCPVGSVQPCSPDRSSDVAAVGGYFYLLIGTSASAPEFAGLQALQDQMLNSRVGNANYLIYLLAATQPHVIFHDNIPGFNGYPSHVGYNWVVGNGTPRGAEYVFDPLGPFAGVPQTASNP